MTHKTSDPTGRGHGLRVVARNDRFIWFARLLLHRLFHADGVGHQLKVAQNLGLPPLDVAFDGCVGQ